MGVAQFRSWVGAERLGEHLAGALVGGKGLGLPPAPVLCQHELGIKALPKRMSRGKWQQFGRQLTVAAKPKPGLRAPLQGLQPKFLKARQFVAVQQLRRNVGEWRSPP